ncbi:hypothetical protein [Oenococcus sicerae]|uniref:hypothetical protein n=1 Tax=Oenococcus sicerae TaxID=2203724 RepID=UPI0010B97AB9|nr:hypothetical protein OAL24_01336 [Oenococcus sicerae]
MIKTDDINELHVNRKFAQGLLRQKISFEFDNFSFNFPNILVIFTSYLFNPLSIFVFFSLQFGFFLLEKERKNERLIQTLASQQKIAFGKALFSLERVIADLTVAFFLAIIVFVLSNKTLLSHGVGSFIYPISFFGHMLPIWQWLLAWVLFGLISFSLLTFISALLYQKIINRPAQKGFKA